MQNKGNDLCKEELLPEIVSISGMQEVPMDSMASCCIIITMLRISMLDPYKIVIPVLSRLHTSSFGIT